MIGGLVVVVVCILFWKTNFIWKSKESFCVLQGDLELLSP